jgi:hypothetical protein
MADPNSLALPRVSGKLVSKFTPAPVRQTDRAPPMSIRGRRPRCGTCGRCSRCRRWTEAEDAFVDSLIGRVELPYIAARLTDRFGLQRTASGISSRLKRRGKSRWMNGLSLRDIERIFGLDHRTILRWWVEPGLIPGRRWSGRGPKHGWLFDIHDLEHFIREHVYMVDPARMQPNHPLERLASVESRCQSWRSAAHLAAYLHMSEARVRRAVRCGLIPHRRRPGAGGFGEICVRADDFALIREQVLMTQLVPRSTTP